MPARKKREKAAGADNNGLAQRQTGTLYTGDNLYFLHGMNSESVDLVYFGRLGLLGPAIQLRATVSRTGKEMQGKYMPPHAKAIISQVPQCLT